MREEEIRERYQELIRIGAISLPEEPQFEESWEKYYQELATGGPSIEVMKTRIKRGEKRLESFRKIRERWDSLSEEEKEQRKIQF